MRIVGETFRFESNRCQITFSEKYSKVKKLKVDRFMYNTASASNYNMVVRVAGWDSHKYNATGTTYTFLQTLPRTTLTEVDYESQEAHWDEVKDIPQDLSTTQIELYINGSSTNTDITSLNPCYIEFKLWLEE